MSKVIICGALFDYEAKQPYVASGKSILGAIECDESLGKVKCHECGRYFERLGVHVRRDHSISPRDYRRAHGLRKQTALTSFSITERNRERFRMRGQPLINPRLAEAAAKGNASRTRAEGYVHGHAETRNLKRRCVEQLLEQIREIAKDLGRAPTWSDLGRLKITHDVMTRILECNGIDEVAALCGLTPNELPSGRPPGIPGIKQYTKVVLVELIRDARFRLGRVPVARDCHPPLLPCADTFASLFGSWNAALDAAGFGLVSRQQAS